MKITELNSNETIELKTFKDAEYPAVDKAHFGVNVPNWKSYEFTLIAKEKNEALD